eukprot:115467-Chlamydomonas_euryale.AAC.1
MPDQALVALGAGVRMPDQALVTLGAGVRMPDQAVVALGAGVRCRTRRLWRWGQVCVAGPGACGAGG